MKNGLLICAGEGKMKNIGDYIQSLAQEQFLDRVDCLVERERLNEFQSDDTVKLIMNAWFMRHPENFPPSDCIKPLFVSFHIVPTIAEKLLNDKVVAYLKKYEPIGARDKGTCEILQRHGIKSYFSGCLTLTLGIKYRADHRSDKILFVDPYFEVPGYKGGIRIPALLSSLWYLANHYKILKKYNKIFPYRHRTFVNRISPRLGKLLATSCFYRAYSKVFTDDVLFQAEFVKCSVPQSMFHGEEEKMDYARQIMKKYAEAKYVVTSRIHCALPCLAVETPVLFVNGKLLNDGTLRSGGRFGGIIDLFHTLTFFDKGVEINSEEIRSLKGNGKIGLDFKFSNSKKYLELANSLKEKVTQFMRG